MPTIITQLSSAASTKLSLFATESLAKSEKQASVSKEDLLIWSQQQDDKLEARITKHLQRKRTGEAELAAIQAWRAENFPTTEE